MQACGRSLLRVTAVALFGMYLIWNALWLTQGQFAPSLMLGLFHLPGPTTGFTRALKAAWQQDWQLSGAYHPLLLPLALLLLLSLGILLRQALTRRRLALPPWNARLWAGLLLLGWFCKLAGDPQYW